MRWVLVTKVTSLGHITSSQTNRYQISSSYSQPSSNFKNSTKYQHLNFKILIKCSLRISTKNNLRNLNQGSAAKYELQLLNIAEASTSDFEHKVWSRFWTKIWFYDQTSAYKVALKYCQHVSKHQHQQQSRPQQVLCGIFTCQGPINQGYLPDYI